MDATETAATEPVAPTDTEEPAPVMPAAGSVIPLLSVFVTAPEFDTV
jgi:hypothetical protein